MSNESDFDSKEPEYLKSEEIYTYNSLDDEVGLYAIEVIAKWVVPLQSKVPRTSTREKPILTNEEITWRLNQIWLCAKLYLEEQDCFRHVLRNFIHLFAFNYKDLWEVTLETYRIELVQNVKATQHKPYRMNTKYAKRVKVELKKLLEYDFIRLV